VLALVLASGLTSMSEAALFSVPISKVYLARDKNRSGSSRLAAIKENMQRPISALVILNNLINILGSVMVGYKAADVLGNDWKGYFAGSLTFLIIVFSEIIPKTIGERYNLGISLIAAIPLTLISWILWPAILVIEQIARPFSGKSSKAVTSEDEIRMMANMGKNAGLISGDESRLISNAFRLNDVTAREIMTHRLDLASLENDTPLEEINPSELDMTHSRFVVTRAGDLDDIAGIIYLRDLLLALAGDRTGLKVGDLKKPAHMVHDSTPAHQLLHQFQVKRQHLFVVLDEYGGTSGVVSLEDVLEELVGEIIDETDPDEEESRNVQGDGTLPQDGQAEV
jgi:CBS domain containing-hemolysin-like protein